MFFGINLLDITYYLYYCYSVYLIKGRRNGMIPPPLCFAAGEVAHHGNWICWRVEGGAIVRQPRPMAGLTEVVG